MPKPDPRQIDPSIYRFSCQIGTRFTDLDPNGHVNFAAMVALLGEGRGLFHAHLGRKELAGTIIVSMKVDYLSEAFYPEPVDILLGVASIGNSSWTFQQLARQNDVAVALCTSVMVVIDQGRAVLTPEWRSTLETYSLQLSDL